MSLKFKFRFCHTFRVLELRKFQSESKMNNTNQSALLKKAFTDSIGKTLGDPCSYGDWVTILPTHYDPYMLSNFAPTKLKNTNFSKSEKINNHKHTYNNQNLYNLTMNIKSWLTDKLIQNSTNRYRSAQLIQNHHKLCIWPKIDTNQRKLFFLQRWQTQKLYLEHNFDASVDRCFGLINMLELNKF